METAKQKTELISQADAARLKGVTRQRIEQLIKSGRLTPETIKVFGREKTRLDKNQVLGLTDGTRGRPRLSDSDKDAREILHGYEIGALIYYSQKVRGIPVTVEAKIVKAGKKRIRIEYMDDTDTAAQAWVRPAFLSMVGAKVGNENASDNETDLEDEEQIDEVQGD